MLNSEIAQRLEEVAWLLNEQGANPYRVQAYRHAAETLRHLPRPVTEILQQEGETWLPILYTQRGERHYTALFSNTARAHQMGKTRDWVVLYYDGGRGERQCTVITSQRGSLTGRRIVRGREDECAWYYQQQQPSSPSSGRAQ